VHRRHGPCAIEFAGRVNLKELYFDNAATSWPKPPAVVGSLAAYQRSVGASAGRGAYPRAVASGEILQDCRAALAGLFNAPDPRRVIFTLNCSDALNLAIFGLPWKRGDRALVTPFEHNSVLRPLHALKEKLGIAIDVMAVDGDGRAIPDRLGKCLRPRTRLVAAVHASNVTGGLQPLAALGAFARRKGLPFLVDAAQSAGAVPIDVRAMKIDLLAFPGHKALLGPLGTGALIVTPGLDLTPLRHGGTGSLSEKEFQPPFYPDRLETGSHNAPGLLGLLEGVRFLRGRGGPAAVQRRERGLMEAFLAGAARVPGLRLFGPSAAAERVAVASFRFGGEAPARTADRLWAKGRLMVRAGLHCAPWAHRWLGTLPDGTFRFSFGPFLTGADIDRALRVLRDL
jgi:cysteine desulfurase family protein